MSTKTLISEGQHLAREHKVVSREEWIGARKETTLMEPCYFLGDGNSANFTLDFPREGLEEDFLVEGPKKFRAHHSSLERAEWQAVRSEKVLRADVARAASID